MIVLLQIFWRVL